MRKNIFFVFLILSVVFFTNYSYANTKFIDSLSLCSDYQKTGSIYHQGQKFDLLITLNKARGNKCIYKEKIYQDNNYQMLTCSFTQNQLEFIKDSMTRYSSLFSKQIQKNPIFEAKLTTNGEVFQQYLVNPEICNITYSKR